MKKLKKSLCGLLIVSLLAGGFALLPFHGAAAVNAATTADSAANVIEVASETGLKMSGFTYQGESTGDIGTGKFYEGQQLGILGVNAAYLMSDEDAFKNGDRIYFAKTYTITYSDNGTIKTYASKTVSIGDVEQMGWKTKINGVGDYTINCVFGLFSYNSTTKKWEATSSGNDSAKSITIKLLGSPSKAKPTADTKIISIKAGKKKATVNFNAVDDVQEVTTIQLKYTVKGTSKWKSKSFKNKSGKSSVVLKKLKKGKKYKIKLRFKNSKGWGSWGKAKTSPKIK